MGEVGAANLTLEFTSTWVVAVVCSVIVLISILVHRFLKCVGQLLSRPKKNCQGLRRHRRKHLFDALQKIKEELMLLGFISLLLSVFQTRIGKICIPQRLAYAWLPCHQPSPSSSTTTADFLTNPIASDGYHRHPIPDGTPDYCSQKGKVPLLSFTALHHLHIFIFVLAIFHMIVCVVIILCGKARLHYWWKWEQCIIENRENERYINEEDLRRKLTQLAEKDGRFSNQGKRSAVIDWLHMIGKHFFPSLTKSEYIAIRVHCVKAGNYGLASPQARNLEKPKDHFEKYVIRGVQKDFDKVVGISWYLWLFVVLFLLLNVAGWNAYFWISFLPLTLLLAVGTKLEHIVKQRTDKIIAAYHSSAGASELKVTDIEFSNEDFWFQKPRLVLNLIHIILFQNSFELAFFFFILFQYDLHSCIIGKVDYVIPRLVIGVFVQIMCSYRTLPLYAIIKKQMRPKNRPKKQKSMKIVTFIWDRIDKWNERKMATNDGSTHGGSREGLVANEQTKAGEIEPEKEADIESQDGTKPACTLKPGEQQLV
ncbi:MLO-like protein 15 isoform X1 [Eucalyptus grandis]|uniref:MLO-like protein 15 isoform X1 n=1 Tax=Eucalyptus grandis TaxID=71139 RepID=UPI00192E99AA|nr:MLO-like protein 15 isoform X1 [Eucalyptus grandis]